MFSEPAWRKIGREWLSAILCYALLIAPFGCELQNAGLLGGDTIGQALNTSSVGLFINDDLTDPMIIAARDGNGDTFFVYGERTDAGGLGQIDSIVVVDADGNESFVQFEDGTGYPIYAEGADGSYARITYEEVSTERLAGNVELFDAGTGEMYEYPVDVDLEETAAQVSEEIQRITGRDLQVTEASLSDSAKSGNERIRVTLIGPWAALIVLPLVAAVALMTVILGQILVLVYELVELAIQAVLLTVFAPLFLISEILGSVVLRVRFVPIRIVFDAVPPLPVVVIG